MRTHYCCVRLFALPGRPFVLSTHRSSDYGPLAYFVPVSLFFLLFSWFVLFSFVVLRFPPPFRFVVFRLLPVSPCSPFSSLPCCPCWRILLFCPGAIPSPALLAVMSWPANLSISRCCDELSFLIYLLFVPFSSFLLYLPFFDFDFGRRFVSSCLFLVGIMLSPRFLLRLRLVQRI